MRQVYAELVGRRRMPEAATVSAGVAESPGRARPRLADRHAGRRKSPRIDLRLFPPPSLCTLVYERGSVSPLIESRRIRTSPLQRLPGATRRYREMLPLFPAAIELFDLDDADLVISTSHCAAKSVVRTGRARHLCYCHSPMRYAWDQFDAYFGRERLGRAGNLLARLALAPIARWDRSTAHRVDRYLANSHYVAGRIARYYNREATVLHPPVDTSFSRRTGESLVAFSWSQLVMLQATRGRR